MEGLYSAFGLTLRAGMPMPWVQSGAPPPGREVALSLEPPAALDEKLGGAPGAVLWETTFPGGRQVTVERQPGGELLIRYADEATFLISADAHDVRCAPADPGSPSWLRFLLDTVLGWTALSHGLHLLHASAVELDAGVCAFTSGTGGGKSTLAGELVLRGGKLFADDIVAMSSDERPLAHPGPPLANIPLERNDLARLGRTIAVLHEGGSEAWVSVRRATDRPDLLAAIFFLRRAPHLRLAVEPVSANVLALVPHMWAPADTGPAAGDRFRVLSDVASQARMFRLEAPLTAPPAMLADVVEQALHSIS